MMLSAVCLVVTVAYLIAGLAKQKEGRKSALDKKQFFLCASVGLVMCVFGWVTGLFG